jgi:hypothetical protein
MNTTPHSSNRTALVAGNAEQDLVGAVRRALAAEPLLGDCCIDTGEAHCASVLYPEGYAGRIDVRLHEGVVRLEGEVTTVGEKRLAGRIARRIPGCRTAVNALRVERGQEPRSGRTR